MLRALRMAWITVGATGCISGAGVFRHTMTYGGDWFEDDVDVEDPLGGAFVYNPSGNREVWGGFVQDKLEFSDWLEIIGGLRYDSYSLESVDGDVESDGNRLSPRITAGVKPFESTGLHGLQVYGTYAEGYRSPSVIETLITGSKLYVTTALDLCSQDRK